MDESLAIAALMRGDAESALGLALEAWQERPSPALARAIAALGELAGEGASAPSWCAAQSASAAARPALLATLLEEGAVKAGERLKIAACWCDPRVDLWCVEQLEQTPLRSAASRAEYWVAHLARTSAIGDRGLLERIEALPERWRRDLAPELALWLCGQLWRRLPAMRERLLRADTDTSEALALEELAARARARETREERRVEELLQAVYASPDDDGPRLVCADAWMEMGDLRGEFVALQIRGDEDSLARSEALLLAHKRRWLGPILDVLARPPIFERGFLARCEIDLRRPDRVRDLAERPEWRTVCAISGSCRLALARGLRALREIAVDMEEAVERERLVEPWVELLSGEARPIEILRYAPSEGARAREIGLLAESRALPRLARLEIVRDAIGVWQMLAGSPVEERLQELHLRVVPGELAGRERAFSGWLEEARLRAVTITLLRGRHETEITFLRGEGRSYSSAEVALGPRGPSIDSRQLVRDLLDLLAALSLPLPPLRIALRRHTDPSVREPLRQQLHKLGAPCVELT